jgi:hypothetical protein
MLIDLHNLRDHGLDLHFFELFNELLFLQQLLSLILS